jgi:hypothetical protein
VVGEAHVDAFIEAARNGRQQPLLTVDGGFRECLATSMQRRPTTHAVQLTDCPETRTLVRSRRSRRWFEAHPCKG